MMQQKIGKRDEEREREGQGNVPQLCPAIELPNPISTATRCRPHRQANSLITIGLTQAKLAGMAEDQGPAGAAEAEAEEPTTGMAETNDQDPSYQPGDSETESNNSSVSSSISGTSTVSIPTGETEQEQAVSYREGGYHPIRIADVIDDRYHVVRKIGFGHFSTVWLTWDSTSPAHDPEFFALKVSKSDRVFADATLTEIKILQKIRDADPNHSYGKFVSGILDNFAVESPNGKHVCMVQHCHGENLLQLIQRGDHKGLPERNVKSITKQLLQGLHYLHAVCGIIHTDIKPENILIDVSPIRVKKMAMKAVDMHRKGEKMPAEFVGSHEFEEQSVPKSNLGLGTSAVLPLSSKLPLVKTEGSVKQEGISPDVKKTEATASPKPESTTCPWKFPEKTIKSILSLQNSEPDPATQECEVTIKIVDFGNACHVDNHYTYLIQTLPYRSPEVVIKAEYGPPADVWSAACVSFEIATGDYLFDGMVGERFAKTEDHLAHIVELLGNVPVSILKQGKHYRKYFTPRGHLKKGHPKRFWPLTDVLTEKYQWPEEKAVAFADFLLPLLHYDQNKRLDGDTASGHPYLSS